MQFAPGPTKTLLFVEDGLKLAGQLMHELENSI
jgi:hypothetical protein